MREYAEEDGFRRWPRHRVAGPRRPDCRSQKRNVLADQHRHVLRYLELLRADGDTGEPAAERADAAWADAESAFTRVARAFGRRHRIDVETWVAVRVPVDVLRRAGFRIPDSSPSESSGNSR